MRRALRWSFATLFVAICGCLAPTLPIPPPATPEVSSPDAATGLVTVKGGPGAVQANAHVTVWNESYAESAACKSDPACAPGVDRVANQDGSYEVKIKAQSGDTLEVWEITGDQQSPEIDVQVP